MNWLRMTLAALTAFRIAWFVVYDRGPFQFMDRFHTWIGRKASRGGVAYQVAELTTCMWCMSVWAGGLAAILALWENPVTTALLTIGGLAGAVLVIFLAIGGSDAAE